MAFSAFNFHPSLVKGIKDLGYVKPSPIQAESIPHAMAGKDLLACASTGSGKTAAFLLPIMHQLLGKPRGITRCLILTPTRELAAQIVADFDNLGAHTGLSAAAVYGGVGPNPQEHAFRKGVDMIVACPGRLMDHMRQPYAKMAGLEFLVFDEADRMFDMGFLPDVKRILGMLPKTKRQTLFFSATMPPAIAALTREVLKSPVQINVERTAAPASGITQAVYPVSQDLKPNLLLHLIQKGLMQEAIVFTRTKHRADRVAKFLVQNKVEAERIHGNRSQAQRTQALAGFKSGKYQILVATDIAARGIDVKELGHVINFDVPNVPEDYIHRVGRTARAEKTGEAFTFVSPDEGGDLRAIERAIKKQLPVITLPDFDYKAKSDQIEIPLADRIAQIRARKADDRARAKINAAKKAKNQAGPQGATRASGSGGGVKRPASGGEARFPQSNTGNRGQGGPRQ